MTYHDVLVHVDETPPAKGRAAVAAAIAARFGAALTGAFLKSEFAANFLVDKPFLALSASDYDDLSARHNAAIEEASETARATFEAAASATGVVSQWLPLDGDTDDALLGLARRTDLTVMPRLASACSGLHQIGAADVALGSGGPVLIVPPIAPVATPGRHVLIAWKGTREAARALRDAWPFIRRAEQVSVVIVSPDGDGGPDSLLQRHFEHHGLTADIIVDGSNDAEAAEVLMRQSRALGADLIVMGLYGRSRVQELLLGGVSRQMLDEATVPLLVSH